MKIDANLHARSEPIGSPVAVPDAPRPTAALRLSSVDVLRGIAATLVAMRHAFDGPFLTGAIGVDIFFVISGFVMAKVATGRTAGAFLVDRAWRIFPAYWLALSACMLVALFQGQALTWRDGLSSALLIPNWFSFATLYVGVAWTLLFELFFYAAVAFGIWLRDWRLPLALFIAAMVARPFVANPLVDFAGSPIMIEFLFGMVIALLPRDRRVGAFLLAAALTFVVLFPNPWLEDYRLAMAYQAAFLRVALWGVPAAMILYGALSFEQQLKGRLVDALLILGGASYSIYLWHMLVIKMVFPGSPLLGLAGSIIVGIGLWWFVERRLMRVRPAALIGSIRQGMMGIRGSQPERA